MKNPHGESDRWPDPAVANARRSVFAQDLVVEGDAKSPRKQRDTWTFERQMGAADPNWRLVATGG